MLTTNIDTESLSDPRAMVARREKQRTMLYWLFGPTEDSSRREHCFVLSWWFEREGTYETADRPALDHGTRCVMVRDIDQPWNFPGHGLALPARLHTLTYEVRGNKQNRFVTVLE